MKGFIKKLLSKKEGLALELALLLLLVVVSLSILLVSVGILGKNTTDSLAQSVYERLSLDQIGQSYISAVKNNANLEEWEESIESYDADATSTGLVLVDSQGKEKLSITIQDNKIIEWKYR